MYLEMYPTIRRDNQNIPIGNYSVVHLISTQLGNPSTNAKVF